MYKILFLVMLPFDDLLFAVSYKGKGPQSSRLLSLQRTVLSFAEFSVTLTNKQVQMLLIPAKHSIF